MWNYVSGYKGWDGGNSRTKQRTDSFSLRPPGGSWVYFESESRRVVPSVKILTDTETVSGSHDNGVSRSRGAEGRPDSNFGSGYPGREIFRPNSSNGRDP